MAAIAVVVELVLVPVVVGRKELEPLVVVPEGVAATASEVLGGLLGATERILH